MCSALDEEIYQGYRNLALMILTVAIQDYKTDYRQFLRGKIKRPNRDMLAKNEWLLKLMLLSHVDYDMEWILNHVERRIEDEEISADDPE